MYYIFNENGDCVASCNYEPDAADLVSRNEMAVVSEESYDISKIKLVNGAIIEVIKEPTLAELKESKLSEIDIWTERKITGGFVSECSGETVTYDSDRDTQNTVSSDLNTIYLAPEEFYLKMLFRIVECDLWVGHSVRHFAFFLLTIPPIIKKQIVKQTCSCCGS